MLHNYISRIRICFYASHTAFLRERDNIHRHMANISLTCKLHSNNNSATTLAISFLDVIYSSVVCRASSIIDANALILLTNVESSMNAIMETPHPSFVEMILARKIRWCYYYLCTLMEKVAFCICSKYSGSFENALQLSLFCTCLINYRRHKTKF